MADENDDIAAQSAEIPDLKAKEKEREKKRGGLFWRGAKPGGSFSGAQGGAGVARSAASASGSLGAAGAGAAGAGGAGFGAGGGLFGGLAGFFANVARFFAGLTLFGKIAVATGAVLFLLGAGIVGLSMLGGSGDGAASTGGPSLGGLASSIKIRAPGGDRWGMDSRGELRFEGGRRPAPTPPPAPPPPPPAEPPPPDIPADAQEHARQSAFGGLSAAKLSSGLGGSAGGKFGSHDVFGGAGSPNAPKFNNSIGQGSMGPLGARRGSTNAFRSSSRSVGGRRQVAQNSSRNALGQLKFARGTSIEGARNSTAENAAALSGAAFDQAQVNPNGGGLGGSGIDAGAGPGPGPGPGPGGNPDTVTPLGDGVPDEPDLPDVPTTPTGTIDPNIQSATDAISQMIQAAKQMKMMGMILMAIGAALCAMGWPAAIAGIALIAMGVMMIQQAARMGAMAKQMGEALAQHVGQYQAGVVNYCTDQALNGGTDVNNCRAPDNLTHETRYRDHNADGRGRVEAYERNSSSTTSDARQGR